MLICNSLLDNFIQCDFNVFCQLKTILLKSLFFSGIFTRSGGGLGTISKWLTFITACTYRIWILTLNAVYFNGAQTSRPGSTSWCHWGSWRINSRPDDGQQPINVVLDFSGDWSHNWIPYSIERILSKVHFWIFSCFLVKVKSWKLSVCLSVW